MLTPSQAGQNDAEAGTQQAMALSGSTLPQVSSGGSVSGTLHIVTSDGAGPYSAYVDTTGTGSSFSQSELEVTQQVPGTKGNIKKSEKRAWARALQSVGLMKRATNINEDYPFSVKLPADMQCTGTVAGQSNVCMVKLVNPSNAGVSVLFAIVKTVTDIYLSHSVVASQFSKQVQVTQLPLLPVVFASSEFKRSA